MKHFDLNARELEEIENEIKRLRKTHLLLHALRDDHAKQELLKEIAEQINSNHGLNCFADSEIVLMAFNEIVGIGIFEKYMKDDSVTDVSYDGNHLWVTDSSGTHRSNENVEVEYVDKIIKRFADTSEQEFTEKNPSVDVQFESIRLQAHHRKTSPEGTVLSMRMARDKLMLTKDNFDKTAPEILDQEILKKIIPAEMSILISGPTGSGKTEFVKYLIQYVPDEKKMIIIEDIKDGHYKKIYPNKHIVALLTNNKKSAQELVVDGLRMNPKYLTLAESRGAEFFDLFVAAGTGHAVLSTLHANSAFTIPDRGYEMIRLAKDFEMSHFMQQFTKRFRFGVQMEEVIVHGETIRYVKEFVEYTPDGPLLIFAQQRYTNQDGVYGVKYGKLSNQTLMQLDIKGLSSSWNEYVEELEKKGGGTK